MFRRFRQNCWNRVTVVNEQGSVFGAGWGLEGLRRLYEQPGGLDVFIDQRRRCGSIVYSFGAQSLWALSFYLSEADSPFNGYDFDSFYLENFEDGLLNVPGVSASTGSVVGPGGATDSVDGDDGTIDGSGTSGKSYLSTVGFQVLRFV